MELSRTFIAGMVLVALLLRVAISLSPYSGHNDPPKFGDYEAQRHWMEIATNLPPADWYRQTPDNDLAYWGMDYPPLSGYQSWLHGKLVGWYEPAAVALHTSRGHESAGSKLALRTTVLASDAATYFPAALATAAVFGRGVGPRRQAALLAGLLLGPSLALVDHGHFQYNCISLGGAAAAAAAVATGRQVLGAMLFSLALNHKHMSLYLAPAFFAYMLGTCLRRPTVAGKVAALARVGLAVLATFAAVWAPWLGSLDSAAVVLRRLFPTQRGLYEDYVANFWCASSRLVKWKALLSQGALVRACAGATLAALLPAAASQVAAPSPRGFLLCMVNSSLAFFLFSYQVHEKSILLPLLPLTLLAALDDPRVSAWAHLLAPFSMYPLLNKDGLALPYAGALALYAAAVQLAPAAAAALAGQGSRGSSSQRGAHTRQRPRRAAVAQAAEQDGDDAVSSDSGFQQPWPAVELVVRHGPKVSAGVAVALHAAAAALPPPRRYPFLYDAAITTWAFLHFAALFLYTNVQQWREYRRARASATLKKRE